ncbi:MAG: metal-dependent phosphohydrolase [Euryarchaeota archaeon]|nr:metal-dependent phosphohydrolase [Euryarchaeota archaeon]MEC9458167.1 HD domain-containing protein [Candidatus Thermoplasmatota archaeon]
MQAPRRSEAAMKIINDAIHGQFKLEGATEELLATPEINKLSHIKQLGLAHLVFPGAHHTRFEHSMGASHIAGMMAESVGLNKQDKSTLEVAAMLHDVGHGPYSHTLEHILSERGGMDHMSVTEGIILGDFDVLIEGEGDSIDERDSIPDILERNDLDPEEVASLIRGPDASGKERSLINWTEGMSDFSGEDKTMAHLIHGSVDCDQLDFLLRDSHFTGVKHGVVDLHPLVGSLGSQGGDVVVDQGGLSALEGMLLARGLMYSAVYFHRVTRVTEVMLSRAVERAGGSLPDSVDLQRRVDSEIWGALSDAGGFAKDMVTRLKYRKLLKICLSRRMEDLSEEQKQLLVSLSNDSESRRALEEELALRSGLEPGYVAIDVPSVKLLLSEPRMSQVDVRVAGDDGKTRWLREITPMADALKNRHVSQEAVYVMTLPGSESKVAEVAERHLFS